MVGFRWIWRLVLTTFWQRPLHFRPPKRAFKPRSLPPASAEQERAPHCFAVVTGGNAGIGFETALFLASCGVTVIIGSRSQHKGDEAIAEMHRRAGKKLDVTCIPLDLADLDSVLHFARQVKSFLGSQSLQLLVNNAGIMDMPYATSKQGHELHFATNHLGHFLLTKHLVPIMRQQEGRVIIVSAELHTLASSASADYKYGSKGDAYNRSKLANIWHAYELQRREPGLVVTAVHPGVISTTLGGFGSVVMTIKRLLFITPESGAWTTLYCCLGDKIQRGAYYHNSLGIVPSSPQSYDESKARTFWEDSEALVKQWA